MSDHETELNVVVDKEGNILDPETTNLRKAKAKPKNRSNDQVTDAVSQSNSKVASPRFLPDDTRKEMVERLKQWGFDLADTYSDTALIDAQNRYINETREKLVTFETHEIGDKIASYAADTRLTNKEFITRLFLLSVPDIYLHLFSDRDHDLSDDEIWEIIRYSPVRPIDHAHEIFKNRFVDKVKEKKRIDQRYGYRGR